MGELDILDGIGGHFGWIKSQSDGIGGQFGKKWTSICRNWTFFYGNGGQFVEIGGQFERIRGQFREFGRFWMKMEVNLEELKVNL